MSSASNFFEISLKNSTKCGIEGLSEDALRELIKSINIKVVDNKFGGFVVSTANIPVRVNFDSSGKFDGIQAILDGQVINLVHGANSNALAIFKGVPSSKNPGPGWEVEVGLTQQYLNQPPNQANWEIFFARRV